MQKYTRLPITLIPIGLLISFIVGYSSSKQQSTTSPVELYVLAAASLNDAVKELIPLYESSHPNQKLVVTYGSSGTLQQQIEQGAPADLFISAGQNQMKTLIDKNIMDTKYTSDFLKNRLVLIVPKNTNNPVKSLEALQDPMTQKIAIGQPDSVPAGSYAKQTLTSMGIWNTLQPKFVFTKDVRQVLSYVETGNVDAGMVYQTDAAISDKVKIVATADEKSHSPIIYPIGMIKNSKHQKESETLYEWLHDQQAINVFKKYGFDSIGEK